MRLDEEGMKTKLAEVTSCAACPFEGWSGYCTKNKSIKCGLEIPDNCPLPDAQTKAIEYLEKVRE